jgi:hypothetical protein
MIRKSFSGDRLFKCRILRYWHPEERGGGSRKAAKYIDQPEESVEHALLPIVYGTLTDAIPLAGLKQHLLKQFLSVL